MKKIYIKVIVLIILLPIITLLSQNNNTIPKQGGICFRVDDNGLIDQFDDYSEVFNRYGQKFTFAMNLGFNEFDTQEYVDSIVSYQNMGHELMDHTPDHRTNYFSTKFDSNNYSTEIGVDHIIGNKICLAHENPDLQLFANTSTASIKNNEIEFSSSDFNDIVKYRERYIYIVELDSLFLVENYHSKKAKITDIWDEEININNQNGITYYTFFQENINLTPDAIVLLANETKKLALLYGLTPPKTFIQPGGNFVDFHSNEISAPMGSLGYTSGATYPSSAEKVYNEYNPDGERQFAMQWGDFVETDQNLDEIKNIIADGVAKNKMLLGNSHWYSDSQNEWDNFLEKNDSLLSWATSNSIPIKTYVEWSDILYSQTPDPYYNIIPQLNVDKDENGIPDGYTNINNPGDYQGSFFIDPNSPGPGENYYSIETDEAWNNKITYILGLGGFEKGENDFSIWTKGAPGDSVEVIISEPWPSNVETSFKFPAESLDWEKQSLGAQGKSFTVNENQSVLDVDIYCSDYVSGTVKIAGMSLSKKVEIKDLELNVLSPIPSLAGDSILVEVVALDEFGNPHDNYFDYFFETSDNSSATILPSQNRSFNGNERDTIIVIDTVAGSFNLAAKLVLDTLVTSDVELFVKHRSVKYLSVISNSDSTTVGDTRMLQIELKDTFMDIIPDSLVTFEALNGNGKFSNGLQNITKLTDTSGVAEALYTASTSTNILADTIKVQYNNTVNDTIILPLTSEQISQFELATISSLPAFEGDSILVEITAKDSFGNEVISSAQYEMSVDSSTTAQFLPSNIYSFSNSSKDTLIVSDSIAGIFNIIAQLQSDTLVVDSTLIDIIYSPKELSLRLMLEGSYSTSSQMNTDINLFLPLEQPYNIVPWNYNGNEIAENISEDIVDWVLITLRGDIDPNNPDLNSAYDVVTKAALLTKDGYAVGLNGLDPISFSVKSGDYYIVVQHRNHLEIMSKETIELY